MRPLPIAAIVGGHGEVEAVPILIRRIAQEIAPTSIINVGPILRVSESRLMRPQEQELERAVEFAARKLGGRGGIFILTDCDWEDGCPAKDAPDLLLRAKKQRADMIISVVMAKKEYEAWFIAASESLRGTRRLIPDLNAPVDPENIRGAKEWLSRHMPSNQPYAETTDQPALTAVFDLNAARRADSFDKCYREVTLIVRRLIDELDS
jgi:hypothetical protein